MSIKTECMVVNLRVSKWAAFKVDKEAGRKVTRDAGAEEDAARVNKHLVPKSALDKIVSADSGARAWFYANTLPWKDNGDRLLPRASYQTFMAEYGVRKKLFDDEVENFLDNVYAKVREVAEFRMGDMFKPEDYPAVADLRGKFAMTLAIDSVTDAADFRVDLDNASVVRAEIAEATNARMKNAMAETWKRLAEPLGHFITKLSEDKVSYKDSTPDNLRKALQDCKAWNLEGDQNLIDIIDRLQDSLDGVDNKTLRKDSGTRAEVVKRASAINDDVKTFMDAFGSAFE
jgi:hypothetical protein